jgi:hypothetical protein
MLLKRGHCKAGILVYFYASKYINLNLACYTLTFNNQARALGFLFDFGKNLYIAIYEPILKLQQKFSVTFVNYGWTEVLNRFIVRCCKKQKMEVNTFSR